MSIRRILLLGEPELRTPAEEVEHFDDELRALVEDMFQTMYHAEGIGLAAPQIGIGLRVLVVDVRGDGNGDGARLALINPEIVTSSRETDKATEGCLSIPGLEDVVERPSRVEVVGSDPEGSEVRIDAGAMLARALQHEIDHLDGILFLDRVSPLKRRLLLKKWRRIRAEEE